MTDSELVIRSLLGGTVNGGILVVIAFLLSRFVRDSAGRGLLVIFLFAAAGAYLGLRSGPAHL